MIIAPDANSPPAADPGAGWPRHLAAQHAPGELYRRRHGFRSAVPGAAQIHSLPDCAQPGRQVRSLHSLVLAVAPAVVAGSDAPVPPRRVVSAAAGGRQLALELRAAAPYCDCVAPTEIKAPLPCRQQPPA